MTSGSSSKRSEDSEVVRAHITLPKGFYEEFRQLADERAMTFSGLVRAALQLYESQKSNDGVPTDFLWLETMLEKNLQQIEGLNEQISRGFKELNEAQTQTASIGHPKEENLEMDVEELEDVLKADKSEMWTVPELSAKLEEEKRQIKSGLWLLKLTYDVERVSPENSEYDIEAWRAI